MACARREFHELWANLRSQVTGNTLNCSVFYMTLSENCRDLMPSSAERYRNNRVGPSRIPYMLGSWHNANWWRTAARLSSRSGTAWGAGAAHALSRRWSSAER